jgi:hypothetical protein
VELPRPHATAPAFTVQRALGAYYTPDLAADVMADWLLRDGGGRVLEPSMGDGVFLQAISRAAARRSRADIDLFGVELSGQAFAQAVDRGLLPRAGAIHADFLGVEPIPCDGVIGNPPYVRLRHLPDAQARTARAAAEAVLGAPMDPAGSVWMPFVLHATRFLCRGGRLAFVLPHDLTYVRYARPLWGFLAEQFGSLAVIRVRERLFEGLLQEVVVLLADDYGGATDDVDFRAFATRADFAQDRPSTTATIPVADVLAGDRPFIEALLPPALRHLLRTTVDRMTVPARDLARFNIGYVSGDKRFFQPDAATVRDYALPDSSLRPAATSTRQLKGAGVFTSGLPSERRRWLFAPAGEGLSESERRYVEAGKAGGVSDRYKCRIRRPWWKVPGLKVPDVLVSVFSERPAMVLNDAGLLASNSLLCGYAHRGVDARALVAAWYTPLTALQVELNVHALGGGVFVLVPNELGRVRLPRIEGRDGDLKALDEAVRSGDMRLAAAWGSEMVLRRRLGLTPGDIELIEAGGDALRSWRKSGGAT